MKFLSTSKKGKKGLRVFAWILALLLLFTTLAAVMPVFVDAQGAEYSADKIIKVGLYFGTRAINSAAMSSYTGFDIGFFDDATKTFSVAQSFDNTNILATVSSDGSAICFVTPEWAPLYTHYGTSSVYIRARSGAPLNLSGNSYPGFCGFSLSGSAMKVINHVYLEDYIKGVVVSEIYSKWPMETLKSQAIVARSYTLFTGVKHSGEGFDICSQAHCQAYLGIDGATEATNRAVDETRGLVVAYNGKPADTLYHSASGPTTESASNAFGSSPEKYPYLCSVDVSWFNEPENYHNGKWSYTISAKELSDYINSKPEYAGILKGPVKTVECESRGESAYVYKITITDTYGNTVSTEKSPSVRSLMGQYVKSACFKVSSCIPVYAGNYEQKILDSANVYVISADGEKTLTAPAGKINVLTSSGVKTIENRASDAEQFFTISGEGYGHGVGMSQYGAMTLAEKGYDYKFILGLYYPGTEIVDHRTLG